MKILPYGTNNFINDEFYLITIVIKSSPICDIDFFSSGNNFKIALFLMCA